MLVRCAMMISPPKDWILHANWRAGIALGRVQLMSHLSELIFQYVLIWKSIQDGQHVCRCVRVGVDCV